MRCSKKNKHTYRSEIKKKLLKCLGWSLLSFILFTVIIVFEINSWPAGNSIAGAFLGLVLPALVKSYQDLSDNTAWKTTQRQLERGKLISNDSIIRISFAYLYRIKVGNKYLLVKNERGTGKYQPVGGVYKFSEREKIELKSLFQVKDDNKIPIDESSRNDYRLRMENKFIRKFIKRFNREADRENISDLSREFCEELIDTKILSWDKIRYRYCGRHITELKFSQHFQIYEILLADIVEILPTQQQENDLRELEKNQSEKYLFASPNEIQRLGVETDTGKLTEDIADHTIKILQEEEGKLEQLSKGDTEFTVSLQQHKAIT